MLNQVLNFIAKRTKRGHWQLFNTGSTYFPKKNFILI
jgi:hypothetical protein